MIHKNHTGYLQSAIFNTGIAFGRATNRQWSRSLITTHTSHTNEFAAYSGGTGSRWSRPEWLGVSVFLWEKMPGRIIFRIKYDFIQFFVDTTFQILANTRGQIESDSVKVLFCVLRYDRPSPLAGFIWTNRQIARSKDFSQEIIKGKCFRFLMGGSRTKTWPEQMFRAHIESAGSIFRCFLSQVWDKTFFWECGAASLTRWSTTVLLYWYTLIAHVVVYSVVLFLSCSA